MTDETFIRRTNDESAAAESSHWAEWDARNRAAPLNAMGDNVTIQKNWQELIRPNKLQVAAGTDPKREATVVAEPLERGFGVTLGNALRRILLSSLQGAAVQSVHIDGVLHEFSSIPGVREDVTDIVLNIKDIAIRMQGEGPKRMVVKKQGPGTVTAGDIQTVGDIVVLNPDLVLCTLDEGAEIRMEFTVNTGKGYVPTERNRPEDAPIGLIPVDSLFSPVRKVSYKVENTREGQILDYDKLTLTIETNGAVTPDDALAYAARILQDQLNVFVNFEEPRKEQVAEVIPDQQYASTSSKEKKKRRQRWLIAPAAAVQVLSLRKSKSNQNKRKSTSMACIDQRDARVRSLRQSHPLYTQAGCKQQTVQRIDRKADAGKDANHPEQLRDPHGAGAAKGAEPKRDVLHRGDRLRGSHGEDIGPGNMGIEQQEVEQWRQGKTGHPEQEPLAATAPPRQEAEQSNQAIKQILAE